MKLTTDTTPLDLLLAAEDAFDPDGPTCPNSMGVVDVAAQELTIRRQYEGYPSRILCPACAYGLRDPLPAKCPRCGRGVHDDGADEVANRGDALDAAIADAVAKAEQAPQPPAAANAKYTKYAKRTQDGKDRTNAAARARYAEKRAKTPAQPEGERTC